MNIFANVLSGIADLFANVPTVACAFLFFDEPVAPEEIL